MIRAAIQRNDLRVPASNDFVAFFGCEVEFDELTHTECYIFKDDHNYVAKLWIGTADHTLGISITSEITEIVRVYDENLLDIQLNEEQQTIVVTLGTLVNNQRIFLTVWPRMMILFTTQGIESRT